MLFRSVVPAVYVLLCRGGEGRGEEVLLQLRQNTGFRDGHWATAAAGHVEEGETVHAAAVREAAEELGVTIDAGDLVPLTVMQRTQHNGLPIDERVDFFFTCARWRGEPQVMEPAKNGGLRWAGLAGLPEPVVPHERFVLDGLRTGTLPVVTAFGF